MSLTVCLRSLKCLCEVESESLWVVLRYFFILGFPLSQEKGQSGRKTKWKGCPYQPKYKWMVWNRLNDLIKWVSIWFIWLFLTWRIWLFSISWYNCPCLVGDEQKKITRSCQNCMWLYLFLKYHRKPTKNFYPKWPNTWKNSTSANLHLSHKGESDGWIKLKLSLSVLICICRL